MARDLRERMNQDPVCARWTSSTTSSPSRTPQLEQQAEQLRAELEAAEAATTRPARGG